MDRPAEFLTEGMLQTLSNSHDVEGHYPQSI